MESMRPQSVQVFRWRMLAVSAEVTSPHSFPHQKALDFGHSKAELWLIDNIVLITGVVG